MKIKNILFLVIMIFGLFIFTGCGGNKTIDGELSDIMKKVYSDISEDKLPNGIMNVVISDDVKTYFLGDINVNYKEAIVSESPIAGSRHSVILIRMDDEVTTKEMKDAVKDFGEKIPTERFLPVTFNKVEVVSNKNLILIVMDDENSDILISNFKKIK